MNNFIHTSESLKAQDGDFENYHYLLEDGEKYQLSKGEKEWLDMVTGRYSIADYILDNSEEDESGNLVLTINIFDMSLALLDDGMFPKAVMLSDDSALQAIFFYSATE